MEVLKKDWRQSRDQISITNMYSGDSHEPFGDGSAGRGNGTGNGKSVKRYLLNIRECNLVVYTEAVSWRF